MSLYPQRIVCLTEETTETLYLLGEQHRIVGISGFTVRPPQARKEKPRVSAFTSANIDKILALKRLHETARRGEFATGLIYIEPDRDDFLTQLNVVDEPLATLPLERIRPGKEALEEIMEALR